MNHHSPATGSAIGRGSLGCAGGLLLGLVGGGLLLVLLSFGWAVISTVPPLPPSTDPNPDLRLILREDFINRVVRDSLGQAGRVDILPDNQLSLAIETDLSELGLAAPVEVVALFELQLAGQAVTVRPLDVQVAGLALPPGLENLFADSLPTVNQDLYQAMSDLSASLGAPLVLTGLTTTETTILIEAREAP